MPFRRHINRICTNQTNFLRQATARSCRRSASYFMTTHPLIVSCEGKTLSLWWKDVDKIPGPSPFFTTSLWGSPSSPCETCLRHHHWPILPRAWTSTNAQRPEEHQEDSWTMNGLSCINVWLRMLRMQLFLADASIPIAIENSESLPAGIFLESHYFAISEDIKAM